jgi:hypothetical protein
MKPSATSTLGLLLGGMLLVLLGSCQNAPDPSGITPTMQPASVPAPRADPQPLLRPSVVPAAAGEPDWLHGHPCPIPCFAGITPGVTTVPEALQLLGTNPQFTAVRVYSDTTKRRIGAIEWDWQESYGGEAFFTPTVDIITSTTPRITPIRLDTLIAAYGAPSDVLALEILVPQQPELEVLRYDLRLVYRHHGLVILVKPPPFTSRNEPVIIGPDTILFNPLFFPATPAGLAQHLREPELHNLVPWAGYQPLALYCRNEFLGACQER